MGSIQEFLAITISYKDGPTWYVLCPICLGVESCLCNPLFPKRRLVHEFLS